MFGLRLTTKRELALMAATIDDLRQQVVKLDGLVFLERKRAEAAINALLLRTAKLAITPDDPKQQVLDEDAMKVRQFNIFGDEQETDVEKEEKELEELQK